MNKAKTKDQILDEHGISRNEFWSPDVVDKAMDEWADQYAIQLKEENAAIHDRLQKQISVGVKDYEEIQRLREALQEIIDTGKNWGWGENFWAVKTASEAISTVNQIKE